MICVDTTLALESQQRREIKLSNPATIYDFKVVTPAKPVFIRVAATQMMGAVDSKLLVVSKVPRDISLTDKKIGCFFQSVEVSSLTLDERALVGCPLDPNSTYYINAASRSYMKVGDHYELRLGYTCGTDSNCYFYFEAGYHQMAVRQHTKSY